MIPKTRYASTQYPMQWFSLSSLVFGKQLWTNMWTPLSTLLRYVILVLNNIVDSIEYITEDLQSGKKISISRQEVLKRTGQLFSLRHSINLGSDLLDTPDFYWDREDLENLYLQTCNYYSISRRTKVMNEKLNHCLELVDLLSNHLSDKHHIRLEWMIIVLIMIEVAFEAIHYSHLLIYPLVFSEYVLPEIIKPM
uniref:Required for meiotic nuclear division protein 1 homolog n=1 Tax=Cacopsylla melanoneura TaxID=428564 RepID=A0A8D8ZEF7_9HEMI